MVEAPLSCIQQCCFCLGGHRWPETEKAAGLSARGLVRFVDLCASAILPTTGFKIRKKAPVLAGSVCMGEVRKNMVHDSDSIVAVCILRLQIFVKMVLKNLRKNRISKNILKFSS
jgi:hypothetical protein